jgi:DeoR family transcriptional regulator, fructose operon transcriptional repressor
VGLTVSPRNNAAQKNYPMLIAERQAKLKDLLGRRGMSDLDTLAAELGVSQSTIRRDVEILEQSGVVKRTHGGVIWLGDQYAAGPQGRGLAQARPYAFDQRTHFKAEVKRQIALAAAKLVEPGQTIILDGGTTTWYFAQELLGRSLQLITNSLPIANLFTNDENVELILTGGLVYPRNGVLLGPAVEATLSTVHAKTLFISVAGIFGGSLYNQNLLLVQSELRMMAQAQQIVLLADAAKFETQALAFLCQLDEVDIVISDAALPEHHREAIKVAGCELIIAPTIAE